MTKLSFAQSLGSNYEEAKAGGASDMEAMTAATLSSLFNSVVESSGGIDALPGTIRGKDLSTGQKAMQWITSALDEGKEEVVQGVITELTEKAVYDKDKQLFSMENEDAVINPRRMAGEFGMGTAIGGIMGGGQMLTQSGLDAVNEMRKPKQTAIPTVDGVMPQVQQENKNAPVINDQSVETMPTSTEAPNFQMQPDAVNVAEHRNTAAQILDEGIFDSQTYGEALEQTGMKRSDVRQALRKVAQNRPGAEADADVQAVLDAIQNVDAQSDAVAQTTPEQKAVEDVPPIIEESEPTATEDFASGIPTENPNEAVGAADYGFSGETGSWKRDADTFVKNTEIPKYDKNGNTISDSAGTMFNMNVPKETKEMIERFSYDGEFSIDHDTNRAQVDRAHSEIERDGFNAVYERTVGAVMEGQASADITAKLGVLMVQAANRAKAEPGSGYDMQAAVLAKLVMQNSNNVAKALQANAIFNKLTPEGRLAAVEKIVEQINNNVSAKNPISENEQSQFTTSVQGAVNEALTSLENLGDTPIAETPAKTSAKTAKEAAVGDVLPKQQKAKKKGEKDHGLEVENWMEEVGNQLAETLSRQPKTPKPKTVSATVKQDLLRFAKDYLPKNKNKAPKRTAVDTLTDFLANREQYVEAWNAAKKAYKESHPDDYGHPLK